MGGGDPQRTPPQIFNNIKQENYRGGVGGGRGGAPPGGVAGRAPIQLPTLAGDTLLGRSPNTGPPHNCF